MRSALNDLVSAVAEGTINIAFGDSRRTGIQ
jgi:hypothetical protein